MWHQYISQLAYSVETTVAAPSPTLKPMHRSVLCVKAREPNPNHSAELPFLSISPTTSVNGATILAFQLPAVMLLPEMNDPHLPSTYTIREYDEDIMLNEYNATQSDQLNIRRAKDRFSM